MRCPRAERGRTANDTPIDDGPGPGRVARRARRAIHPGSRTRHEGGADGGRGVAVTDRQPELRGELANRGRAVSKRGHSGEMARGRSSRSWVVWPVEVAHAEKRDAGDHPAWRAGRRVRRLPVRRRFRAQGRGRRNRHRHERKTAPGTSAAISSSERRNAKSAKAAEGKLLDFSARFASFAFNRRLVPGPTGSAAPRRSSGCSGDSRVPCR
jgi:hypothetical protein